MFETLSGVLGVRGGGNTPLSVSTMGLEASCNVTLCQTGVGSRRGQAERYQFPKELRLVPNIVEPLPLSLSLSSPLSSALLSPLSFIHKFNSLRQNNIACVKLVFDSIVLLVQVSHSLLDLVAWNTTSSLT